MRQIFYILIVFTFAVLGSLMLVRFEDRSAEQARPRRDLGSFELTNGDGNAFTDQDLHGRWSLIFLGYTHCPDICPTTLATLGRILRDLEKEKPSVHDRLQVVFISIDPERDAPAQLKTYTNYFHPNIIGATASPVELKKLARQLGAEFFIDKKRQEAGEAGVFHDGRVFLVSPAGRLTRDFHEPLDRNLLKSALDQVLIGEFEGSAKES